MSLITHIRFVLTSGNVDFYTDEIAETPIIYQKNIQVQTSQDSLPVIFMDGDEWAKLQLTFVHYYSTTRAKIEQLIDEEKEMVCYYAYKYYTTTRSLNCIFLPESSTKSYIYYLGEEAAKIKQTLTFLQSS